MGEQFEFVAIGIPRTPQTKRATSRAAWKATVRQAALAAWQPGRIPYSGEICVQMVYFHPGPTEIDIDGIAKLVLDAMEGVVIENDRQVSQLFLRRTSLPLGSELRNPSMLLIESISTQSHFIYVRIGEKPDHSELPPC